MKLPPWATVAAPSACRFSSVSQMPGSRGMATVPVGMPASESTPHGVKTLPGRRGEVLELPDQRLGGRAGSGDDAEGDHGTRFLVNGLQKVQVAQHKGRAAEHENRETQLQADFQHLAGELELALGRLVVAGENHIYRQAAERLAQQEGGVLLDFDQVREGIGIGVIVVAGLVFVRDIFLLAAVAELAAMLAAQVGICAVAGPEPVVSALALVQDGLGLVEHEAGAGRHQETGVRGQVSGVRYQGSGGGRRGRQGVEDDEGFAFGDAQQVFLLDAAAQAFQPEHGARSCGGDG